MSFKNEKENEDSEDVEFTPKPSVVFKRPTGQSVNLYFYGDIEGPDNYIKVVEEIKNLTQNDELNLHLSTYGGRIDGLLVLLTAIGQTPALVRAHLDSHAFSAGAILFLAAQEWVVPDARSIMFHHYSGGVFGKSHEITSYVNSNNACFGQLIQNYCKDFLTADEIDDIIAGKDLYLQSSDIKIKLANLIKARTVEVQNTNAEPKKVVKKVKKTK